MKSTGLELKWSPRIDAELLLDNLQFAPSPDDMPALTEHLGVKAQDTYTASLFGPLDEIPDAKTYMGKDHQEGVDQNTDSPVPDLLPVCVWRLSEEHILERFAHALIMQDRSRRQMNVVKAAGVAAVLEVLAGTAVAAGGSYWGFLAAPAAAVTFGGAKLYIRSWRNAPPVEVPDLAGLRSPIRITPRSNPA